jgi:dihydrodipicolinate synthase/N-acetylneuraminate lyase
VAAAVTPLREDGEALDEEAIPPLAGFLAAGGADGILALGTTGEGIMLTLEERRRAAERFIQARPEAFAVAVHCGAQTTADTVALSAHAAAVGADAVAVIPPPYYRFDPESLLSHLTSAAAACAPTPFYVYEFAARSGYPVPLTVIERLREVASNLRGLKVSDTPFEAVRPYLLEGLDVLIGSEPLVLEGLARGAVGTVSGLASAFPELISELVRVRSEEAHRVVVELRARMEALPFQAALKAVLIERGLALHPAVRAPLRTLTTAERDRALATLEWVSASWPSRPPRTATAQPTRP